MTLHPRSFVDKVVCAGVPTCADPERSIPRLINVPANVLGPPSYHLKARRKEGRGIYSLGCRGTGVWEFSDNVVVDVPGDDIFVFEVGKAKEATSVELSENGFEWIGVGEVAGSKASIDIAEHIKPGQVFRFVRLTDLGTSCGHRTEGADIDAIAAYAFSWTVVQDDSSTVFFDFGEFELKPRARTALDNLVGRYKDLRSYRLEVVGHTDHVGDEDDNQSLSERRALAVATYLSSRGLVPGEKVGVFGAGELKPKVPNEYEAGRAKNRRVELHFIPVNPCR